MSDYKLLPCAHCGYAKNELYNNEDEDTKGFFWTGILCNCCRVGFSIGGISIETNQEIILQKWNRRSPQPVCVTVPPLEWGEWKDSADEINRWKRSKCGRYDIHHDKVFGEYESFLDQTDSPINNVDEGMEQEAEEACQAHAQAKVNRAIQGCNVVQWRNPQGLADALHHIVYLDEETNIPDDGEDEILLYSDSSFREFAASEARSALEKWEDGK